jgi:type I restriction enzyme M protein
MGDSVGTFAEAKQDFDKKFGATSLIKKSIVTVDGKYINDIQLRNSKGGVLEEYYKWQFIHALIESGLYAKDYIGAEIRFPKGNKSSAPIKLDAAIFDDSDWLDHYLKYWTTKDGAHLEWLNEHLLCTTEFKQGDKEIERVFSGQIKPAMNQKDPSTEFVLGVYYDAERLFLFQRKLGAVIRFDEGKNQKGQLSKVGDLTLHLPDPYVYIPSFIELRDHIAKPKAYDRSKRSIADLDIITSIRTVQIQNALSQVLRALSSTMTRLISAPSAEAWSN